MPRRASFPRYPRRSHKSGLARIRHGGRDVYLGPFGSPESWAEYNRLLGEWQAQATVRPQFDHSSTTLGPHCDPTARTTFAHSCPLPPTPAHTARTIADLIALFLIHAEEHYRHPDGTPKSELGNFRDAFAPLRALYGTWQIGQFTPKRLKDLQKAMAQGSWREGQEGWCRRVCNRQTTRIKTFLRWCESEELVPPGTWANFATVRALEEGQHGARETEEVPPVPEADLQATLPHLPPVPRLIVETLLLTGARPGEVLRWRPLDIDRTGEVEVARNYRVQLGSIWAVQPRKHKTAHKGHRRVILIGPKLQALLAPLLEGRPPDAWIFSPAESVARQREASRAARRSKVQPSQEDRSRPDARRKPGGRYTPRVLMNAVRRAIRRANRKRGPDQPEIQHWVIYSLRHNAATRLLEQFGPEVTKTILGHRSFALLATYALDSLKKAAAAMEQAG